MDKFPENIREVQRRAAAIPHRLDIDLSVALTNQPYDISGNMFYIFEAPDESSYVDVRVNDTRESAFRLRVQSGLLTPFKRLYVTTPAGQAGTITCIYGTEAPELLQVIDNRSAGIAGVGGLLDELRGDITPENWGEAAVGVAAVLLIAANASRKACWIHADIDNTGNIYLGFTNGVTTAAGGALWFAVLAPGDGWGVDDYRGDIYGIATVAAQLVGVGEW